MDQSHHFTSYPSVRQSASYGQFMKKIGWQVEIDPETHIAAFIKKFPYVGLSAIKVQRANPALINVGWVRNLAKRHHSLATHIEFNLDIDQDIPQKLQSELTKYGFRQTKSGFLPTKTLVIPVYNSEDSLKEQMKSKTRYNIGKANRNQLHTSIYSGKEVFYNHAFEKMYSVLQENAKRKKMYIYPEAWLKKQCQTFGDNCFVINVSRDDKTVATALFITNRYTATYQHNGSTELGRKLHAPTLAIWTAIKEAKKRDLKYLDFDGIIDPRTPLKRWQGFTRFKKGFGGQEISYHTSFAKLGWL